VDGALEVDGSIGLRIVVDVRSQHMAQANPGGGIVQD
jgi:hypothetical protein